ncbi:MAG: hypothetical protein QOK44_1174 [Betaproteobacteria bacterium]|nr:hypothetical protein [Betaproteobacteria bacterium]
MAEPWVGFMAAAVTRASMVTKGFMVMRAFVAANFTATTFILLSADLLAVWVWCRTLTGRSMLIPIRLRTSNRVLRTRLSKLIISAQVRICTTRT